jgi:uncharacterized protein with HEPN domain
MARRPLRLRFKDLEKACHYLLAARARPVSIEDKATEETWWAIERAFEILSEASRHLPPEFKARHPGINWRGIADIGNVLRHAYDGVNRYQLWDIMAIDIPELKSIIDRELNEI